MLDFASWDVSGWEIAALAADFVVIYFLNRSCRNKTKDAELVTNAPSYAIGSELQLALAESKDNVLPYACVLGITEPLGKPLQSRHTDLLGVVQHQSLVEHKSRRTQGFWADTKNVIKNQTDVCPFALVNADQNVGSKIRVELTDVLHADSLLESLQVTHDHFNPSSSELLSRVFDRLFGDISKGYQETEKMLPVGSPVLCIGKLVMETGKRIVMGPSDDSHRYIITKGTRSQLVRSLKSDARVLRIFCWVFGLTGAALLFYVVYRNVVRIRRETQARRLLDEHRLQRRIATGAADDVTGSNNIIAPCVVCLSRPRDVILLECGHVCACSECALALPSPKHCPICRESVDRIVPAYVS